VRLGGLEHRFDERFAADSHAFGEVPHSHFDQHGAGQGALLTIDHRFGGFGTEAATDDLTIVVEDGLAFFIGPAEVDGC
jgi:hypothetical protein